MVAACGGVGASPEIHCCHGGYDQHRGAGHHHRPPGGDDHECAGGCHRQWPGPGGAGAGSQHESGRCIGKEHYRGEGCRKCHGLDSRGTADGPDIRGASRDEIVVALLDVAEMQWEVELRSSEIDAAHAYLEYLTALPEG